MGQWLSNLRRPGALADKPEWEAALQAVDEDWNPGWPAEWQRHFAALRELVRDEEGPVEVLPGVTVHGMDIGRWLARQRKPEVWAALADGQRERLEAVGVVPLAPERCYPPRIMLNAERHHGPHARPGAARSRLAGQRGVHDPLQASTSHPADQGAEGRLPLAAPRPARTLTRPR
ncbi:hypothetical protein GCM10017744_103470 [Streptomyces antimycoticus]